jgi:uncharacterized protein YndB with AHSA1/START domain
MKDEPIIVERTLIAPVARVWKALTSKDDMKQWYFDIADFKPKPGFEFQFWGGSDDKQYLHLCRITDAAIGKKLSYSWRYDGYEGNSQVTFELFPDGNKTRLKLTHEGSDTFSKNGLDFARESFAEGWTQIVDKMLREFVETP